MPISKGKANFDHIWYEMASNGQIYIYLTINNH